MTYMLAVQAAAHCPKHSRNANKKIKPKKQKVTNAQHCRNKAIRIDRFSRFFFPFLFTVLNAAYWITFAQYL
jgi:hypothetical protein